ncbi:MAG: DMT family transporter [Lachnospiraceae bacterium]|nr:DMT family transporter [Lachnospiraceae bacterium]
MNKQKQKGIRFILCAAFFFAMMNLFVKEAGDLPVWQKCFFRNLVAGFIAVGMLLKKKERIVIPKGNGWPLLMRCVGGTLGILCNFYAIGKMNIADASMLNKLSPFFSIILSVFLLKERPNKKEVLAVLLAFSGALFVVKPSFQMECIPAVFGVASGLGAGIAYTYVRKMSKNGMKSDVIVFCFAVFSCVSVIPGMLLTYEPMTTKQLICLLLAGASAAGGQFSITAAYFHAPAKEISVFDYTQVIFAAILSFIVFRDLPDVWSFVGYTIIIGTAVWKWRVGREEISKEG